MSRILIALFWLGLIPSPAAVADEAADVAKVEAAACAGATVGQRLQEEIQSHSRRDLGWRVFAEADHRDLERSLRISKAMEARYRWRIDAAGNIEPVSDAARQLCATPP
ncbi:hypothetical protein [Methylococcus geothermalis]|uniref:Uncharacterized protein n=1 Tax=Methylococcus geothermalis TaxID=2681310 RepID=A0A858Q6H1_9GAMM|nr:hypothetical protein [Methylococcus geothermalis]QJD29384.1 hypothetical protein GNH96_05000 [Methylococcus geothermalis]